MVWYGMVSRIRLSACLLAGGVDEFPHQPTGPGQHLTLHTRTLRPFGTFLPAGVYNPLYLLCV